MNVDDPVIIEAALNGVTSRERNPNVPITPEEHTVDGIACIDAGATVIHTHTHDLFAPPEIAADAYAHAYRAILSERPGAICYPTTGIGPTIEVRYGHVPLLEKEGVIRAAFVDTGSVNLGGTGRDGLPPHSDYVYTNTFTDIAYKMQTCADLGLGPSIAVFEPGFLRTVLAYHHADALPAGTLVKFYFSGGGYLGGGEPLWGAPPIIEALDLYLAMLGDAPIPWAVAVLGGSLVDTPIARAALERGGHLRVGLEDFQDGPTNAEQVQAAADLVERTGRRLASISETVDLLRLPEPIA